MTTATLVTVVVAAVPSQNLGESGRGRADSGTSMYSPCGDSMTIEACFRLRQT
ncbi:hypothetical protein [Streptomyces sp. NPDC092307]|uniref:hypothetical protein n=1 Tax=Streptomyces sp. NPDC092307 TaxID=3366013 RepID=UPI003812E04C